MPNLCQQYSEQPQSQGYNGQQQPAIPSQQSYGQPQSNVRIQQRPNDSADSKPTERQVSFLGNVGILIQISSEFSVESREIPSLPAQRERSRNDQRVNPYPTQVPQHQRCQTPPPRQVPLQAETRSQTRNNLPSSEIETETQATIGRSQQQRATQVQEPQRRNARFQQAVGEQEEERVVTTRRKPHELLPPIRGIISHDQFTPDSILEASIILKFRQLLDVALVVRRQIAVSMKSSIPRNQVPKNR
jgi:ribosomal protein L44E